MSAYAGLVQSSLLGKDSLSPSLLCVRTEKERQGETLFTSSYLVKFLGVLDANKLLTRLGAVWEIKSHGWLFDAVSQHEFEGLGKAVIHLGWQIHYMHESSSSCISITFASRAEICIMFSIIFLLTPVKILGVNKGKEYTAKWRDKHVM